MNEERRINEELKAELEQLRKRVRDLEQERGNMRDTLKDSEERLRLIFENSPLGMGFIGVDGVLMDCNDAFVQTIGKPREQLVGFQIKTGITDEAVAVALGRAFSGTVGAFEGDYPAATTGGKRVMLRTLFAPLFGRDHSLRGVLFIAENISERKRAEQQLKESEAMLQQSQRVARIGHYIYDIAAESWSGSPALDDIFGIGPDYSRTFEGWQRIVHAEQREEMTKYLQDHVVRDKRSFDKEYRITRRADGAERWVHGLGNLEFNAAGQPVKMFGTIQDVTEYKRANESLREKETKYRLLFDSANDGIFIHDETGFLDCNRRGAEMYGLRREDIIGRSPGEFAPERQPDGRLSADVAGEKIRAAMSGVPQVFEWQPVRADGSPFDVEVTLSRLALDGKACLQAIVRDIGERKRLEQERLKTQKLESIGTLAGGIAHDFNNLLQGLFGYISMAKRTIDRKEKSLAMLEQAEKALHLSVNLTTQLLTFSKGGSPVKKKIAVRPLIENAAKFALSGSRASYRLLAGENTASIDADEGQIGQVIQNIVLNADQSMPLGGTIEIGAQHVHAPFQGRPPGLGHGDFVAISIKDSGIGIPEAFLAKVFDPYFTTKDKGSGLGLATSYSIVKNHGGLIDVQSEVGKGSVFTIYLPAAAATETETPARAASPGAGLRGRILVMDDEEIVRMVAGELLLSLGHDADFAVHGAEVIEKYRQALTSGRPYDIVILDLTVRGGMGGLETLKILLEIDPAVKAVVSSGYSDDAALSNHKKHGFLSSLRKPYDLEELHDLLNRLLRK